MKPKSVSDFDFTPGDLLVDRSQDGLLSPGRSDSRLPTGGAGVWKSYSATLARAQVLAVPTSEEVLESADLTPMLPSEFPLYITQCLAAGRDKLVLDDGFLLPGTRQGAGRQQKRYAPYR